MNHCDHRAIDWFERQVAVDRFAPTNEGTCEDCGATVRAYEDWDEEGRTWGIEIVEEAE